MKAFVIADRAPQGDIRKLVVDQNIDIIITLGDLDYADLTELKYITDIPKIGVYGNHCLGTYMVPLGIINMHLQAYQWRGIRFGGFQGCVRYKQNPEAIMCTQDEADTKMIGFPAVDVFLSHAPPYGINDEPGDPTHEGFRALREYLEVNKPKVWLHGHTYPSEENIVRQYGDTRIEYIYRQAIVSL
ncbi:metallophosphoesterase [Candidatus Saccharibacteria bacterium]|nr:metallophosphoesterase [Candidatus Saccharibacteria bacterium]